MKTLLVMMITMLMVVWAQDRFSVSGTLEYQSGSCPIDWVPMSGQRGDTLTINLESTEFDSYLYLSRHDSIENAYLIDADDDSGGGLNAEIQHTLERDGFVYVGVSSLDCNTGSYTLQSHKFTPNPSDTYSLVGVLGDQSEQMLDGRYINWHRVYLPRGRVTIWQTSDVFDAFIFLATDTGSVSPSSRDILERSDDCNDGLNACVTLMVDQSAYYLVGASSYSAHEQGFYKVEISTQTTSVEPRPENIQRPGSFTRDDVRFYMDHTPIDWHTFTVASGGARVVIDLTSTEVDPYLILARCQIRDEMDDNRCSLQVNDDGREGLNAQLDVMLESGTYYIGANTRDVEFGSYTLYVQQMPEQFNSRALLSNLE